MSEKELWHQMTEKFFTNSVAVICGTISGNLEVIDIDNKNKAGVEALVFQNIASLFPDVWDKLRIHKTPSGGYHILYKVNAEVPGNKKLASCKNGEDKPKCFLETRGEGGYVLLPPSLGYSIHLDRTIPTITWEQRCNLIAICQSFDEIPKKEEYSSGKKEDDYYDVNPFEHFNKSSEAEHLLEQHGWKFKEQNAKFIWFTRPGSQSGNIHAAFLKERKLFYFFTTNSEFETERCYQPSTVLSKLEHSDNKKLTYQTLVQKGFGKIKQTVEQRIISRANADTLVPSNMSEANRAALEGAKASAKAKYPYGIFWEITERGKIEILREGIYRVAKGLGFRFDAIMQEVVQINKNIIKKIDKRFFYDQMKSYIKEPDEVHNAYEAFLQRSGNFSIERIELLPEENILRDTRKVCYKFYEDIFISINAEGYEEHDYSELSSSQLIWDEQIQKRKLRIGDSGMFVDFLEKAVEYDKRQKYIELIIGYLAHNYKDEATPYIPVLVEMCEDPRHGGGSGKNLFCKLFEHTTTVTGTPGAQVKYDEKILQSWDGERIFVISDAPKDFKFIFFKELSSGAGKIKKLYHNESNVPIHRMPKFVIQTNYGIDTVDGGLARRLLQIEFTDFFTKTKGVDVFYNCHFPRGWKEEDWAGYDGTIIRSIVRWLAADLKCEQEQMTEGGWRKQFEQTHGRTCYDFVKEYFEGWVAAQMVRNDDFRKQLDDFYIERSIPKMYQPTTFRVNKAIEDYCTHNEVKYQGDTKRTENGIQFKCRIFLKKIDEAPF